MKNFSKKFITLLIIVLISVVTGCFGGGDSDDDKNDTYTNSHLPSSYKVDAPDSIKNSRAQAESVGYQLVSMFI